ncbi:MAG: hypothetical protein C5B48_12810 [Candidatus Rokuibacteriota bacterium]|nr:MAG: hypothetical protein C5B48_12810 [Candidatus Rokubacteria bacterium]
MTLTTYLTRVLALIVGLELLVMATDGVVHATGTQPVSTREGIHCSVLASELPQVPNPGDGWRYRYLMSERRVLATTSVPNPGDGWRYRYLGCASVR